ncbi:hypothetical protein Taro_000093 [Colocasia esculenta]|uniref:Uncharacterized protein n=1 Tax=Colocasia esculenta TaxID=4460 RepID=A0A843TFQ6_COLES|nr:hypothetical protein [Colocasia esculenta]
MSLLLPPPLSARGLLQKLWTAKALWGTEMRVSSIFLTIQRPAGLSMNVSLARWGRGLHASCFKGKGRGRQGRSARSVFHLSVLPLVVGCLLQLCAPPSKCAELITDRDNVDGELAAENMVS